MTSLRGKNIVVGAGEHGNLVARLCQVQQGSRDTLTLWWYDRAGNAIDLTGATLTADWTDGTNTYGVDGTLTPDSDQSANKGRFTWALGEGDTGTAGVHEIQFTAVIGGLPFYSYVLRYEVVESLDADAVAAGALVGISSAEAAWLTAGLAAGGAATEDNLASFSAVGVPEDSGVAKTAVGNATKLQARTLAGTAPTDGQAVVWSDSNNQWEPGDVTADTSALLPKSAGSGEALTGTLYLDPGSDDAAQLLKIPVTSSDGADFNFNLAKVNFAGTDDITFNWGFNASGGGAESAAKHAWYLQLEDDYYVGGVHYSEYHLNLIPAGGSTLRPFEYKYAIDGSVGTITTRASALTFMDITNTHGSLTASLGATAAASEYKFYANMGIYSGRNLVMSGGQISIQNSAIDRTMTISGDATTFYVSRTGGNAGLLFSNFTAVVMNVLDVRPTYAAFSGNISILGDYNFIFNGANGTKIPNSNLQKMGFWGVTPVVQPTLATGASHTVDDVISMLQTIGLCKQS